MFPHLTHDRVRSQERLALPGPNSSGSAGIVDQFAQYRRDFALPHAALRNAHHRVVNTSAAANPTRLLPSKGRFRYRNCRTEQPQVANSVLTSVPRDLVLENKQHLRERQKPWLVHNYSASFANVGAKRRLIRSNDAANSPSVCDVSGDITMLLPSVVISNGVSIVTLSSSRMSAVIHTTDTAKLHEHNSAAIGYSASSGTCRPQSGNQSRRRRPRWNAPHASC